MLLACTHLLFQPQRAQFATPHQFGVLYEEVVIKTQDQPNLHGWMLLSNGDAIGTVLFFHGNGENISTHFANIHWLTEHGYNVYLFDYRGYGKSDGYAQLDGVISDAEAMIRYSAAQIPTEEKLVVIGHSLGGSLALHAVAHSDYKSRIKTLITVEAFADYHQITQDVLSTSWLTWLFQWPLSFVIDNSYRPLNAVAKISPIPLLLMHSEQDQIIPFRHAQSLYDAAAQPKTLQIIKGRHNFIFNSLKNRKIVLEYLSALKK